MINYLTNTLVSLEINGQKKSFLNSETNRNYLKENIPADIWHQILELWGETPYVQIEEEMTPELCIKIQNEKIQQLKKECMNTITNGITIGEEHFSFEITDQLNIARLINQVKDGRTKVIYHADGQPCRFFSAEEISNLNDAMENFIEYHTTYFNSLKEYIKTLKLQSKLSAVQYGMEIPNNNLQLLLLNQEVE